MADFFGEDHETPEIDPNHDYLEEYVGDGKKFRDEKELARAKAEADLHIQRIEAENQAYREKLQQTKSLEELMDQINERANNHRQDGGNPPPENEPAPADNRVSAEDLDKLVDEKMTARQKADQAKTNQTWVMQQLQTMFGRDYGQRVQAAAAELGMTKDEMTELASQRPKAFLKLVDDNQPGPTKRGNSSPPDSRVNTQVTQGNSGVKNYAYYRNLRKQDPKLYQSARVQSEMHREAIKQGAAFFD